MRDLRTILPIETKETTAWFSLGREIPPRVVRSSIQIFREGDLPAVWNASSCAEDGWKQFWHCSFNFPDSGKVIYRPCTQLHDMVLRVSKHWPEFMIRILVRADVSLSMRAPRLIPPYAAKWGVWCSKFKPWGSVFWSERLVVSANGARAITGGLCRGWGQNNFFS